MTQRIVVCTEIKGVVSIQTLMPPMSVSNRMELLFMQFSVILKIALKLIHYLGPFTSIFLGDFFWVGTYLHHVCNLPLNEAQRGNLQSPTQRPKGGTGETAK